jgi:hypothetical protein
VIIKKFKVRSSKFKKFEVPSFKTLADRLALRTPGAPFTLIRNVSGQKLQAIEVCGHVRAL